MVDLVGYDTRDGAVENRDATNAVDVLVFDFDGERAGDFAADIEEGPAAFVLLVGFGGLTDDLRVEQAETPVAPDSAL